METLENKKNMGKKRKKSHQSFPFFGFLGGEEGKIFSKRHFLGS